jgi:DNA polymerase-3 subunit epsilon
MALIPDPLPIHSKPSDRDVVIDWARDLLVQKNFVILDTETTGAGTTDEIVQIGIIDADGIGLVDSLVKPEKTRRMPPKAQEVHGISMKMLKNAPTFFEIFPGILNAIGDKWVICYNDSFDIRLIEQTASKYDFSSRGYQVDMRSKCAMSAYSQFIGAIGKYSDYAWQRLPRREAIDHRAIDDCYLTLDLIKEIAATPKHQELISITLSESSEMILTGVEEAGREIASAV